MCGVLGQIALNGTVDPASFAKRLHAQKHRGPDGQHTWMSPHRAVALGHNLLSLTGKHQVQQPLFSEDEQIAATVNGEFYGYAKIRTDLETKGHHFRSDTDSEIVVHLYEEYGEACVDHLRGEFAFIIWDAHKGRLFAARDRFGIKPLHYRLDSQDFLIASEAKAILQSSENSRWNSTALHRVFTHQYLAPDECLFEGVHQLPPAHTLIFEDGKLSIKRYWEPGSRASRQGEASDLLALFQNSVIDRLHPNAAFSLSAGIDSSTVAALASRHLGKEIPAFSVSFDEKLYDELPSVRRSARELGARITPVPVTRQDLLSHLPQAVEMSEGLAINGQLVGKHLLNQAISEAGYRVVISGEGADEALLGYAHLMADHAPSQPLSHPLQRGIMLPAEGDSIITPLPSWLGKWPTFLQAKWSFCRQFAPLLEPDFRQAVLKSDPLSDTMRRIEGCGFTLPQQDTPHQSAWLWTRLALANAILKTLGDGTEMPHGLGGRVPFLDHRFFEYAWSLPTSQKLSKGRSKAIFRDAVSEILPAEIREREKHPFLAPPLLGCPTARSEIRDQINSSSFNDLTFIDATATRTWFDRVAKGSPADHQQADPIIHTLLSSLALQNAYRLTL